MWHVAALHQHLHQTTTPDTSGCFSMSTCRLPLLSKCSMSWKLVFPACLYLHNPAPVTKRGALHMTLHTEAVCL